MRRKDYFYGCYSSDIPRLGRKLFVQISISEVHTVLVGAYCCGRERWPTVTCFLSLMFRWIRLTRIVFLGVTVSVFPG